MQILKHHQIEICIAHQDLGVSITLKFIEFVKMRNATQQNIEGY